MLFDWSSNFVGKCFYTPHKIFLQFPADLVTFTEEIFKGGLSGRMTQQFLNVLESFST